MTTELNKESLEECVIAMRKLGETDAISIRPTKLFIPRFPDESDENYRLRVESARKIVSKVIVSL